MIVIILLAISPAFGLAIYHAREQRQMVRIQAEADAMRIVRLIAEHHIETIEASRQLLFVLAQMPEVRGADPETCSAFLHTVNANSGASYTNIVKVDLDWNIVCDANLSQFSGKIPADGFPQRIVETRSFAIGNYILSPTTNKPTIGFGYPILDEEGQVDALLIAGLELETLNSLITEVLMPPGSTFTMWDRNGTILARYPDAEQWIGKTETVEAIAQAIASGREEGTVEGVGLDGERKLFAYAPLRNAPDTAVYIRVGIPQEVAFAAVNETLQKSLWTLGLVAILALIVAWICGDVFFIRRIRALLAVTNRMASGDLSARTGMRNDDGEIGSLAQAFDRMGDMLEKREKERMEAHTALIREEQHRARLLHNVITAHEDERNRIARELHDETSQSLTALIVGSNTACMALDKNDPKAKTHLENVKSIAEGMLLEIHRLIADLRPSSLDDLGLGPAILSYGETRLKPSGVALYLQSEGIDGRLPSILETPLFRIVQEAFTNIIRHSCATRVDVGLKFCGDTLYLHIADNGKGFDLAELSQDSQGKGFGLQGMQERVRMLNGEFEIRTAPGQGTEIIIQVPISAEVNEHA